MGQLGNEVQYVGGILMRNSPISFRNLAALIKSKQSELNVTSSLPSQASYKLSELDIRNALAFLFKHNLVGMDYNEFD